MFDITPECVLFIGLEPCLFHYGSFTGHRSLVILGLYIAMTWEGFP
jgi:hypothetical protein